MSNNDSNYREEAFKCWRANRSLEAGKLIFENLPKNAGPTWAAKVLRLVSERTGVHSTAIDDVLSLSSHPAKWKTAHDVFSQVRAATLELEKLPVKSPPETLLLHVTMLAELVAKVTYNATNPSDEFDEDSGWWIAKCLKDLLDLLGDEQFSEVMWSTLVSPQGDFH